MIEASPTERHELAQGGSVDVFRRGDVTLHSYCSPIDGEFVRSQLIETEHSVVVIDVQLLRRYARELRSYADGLAKPIERVILSHWHPDHWFGVESFADRPRWALQDVIGQLEAMGDWWIGFRKPEFGDEILDAKVVPTNVVAEGTDSVDGVQIGFRRVVEAEGLTNLVVELPASGVLIAQDLVYNRVYPFVGELHGPERSVRCFPGWVAALRTLADRSYELVLPGHGEPSDAAVIGVMIDCLATIERILDSSADAEEFKRRVKAAFPDYRLPLLVDLSTLTLFNLLTSGDAAS
jgi:glyoxylase-like metal-dependent hydrolase (beta-lactamase superfamily II)